MYICICDWVDVYGRIENSGDFFEGVGMKGFYRENCGTRRVCQSIADGCHSDDHS